MNDQTGRPVNIISIPGTYDRGVTKHVQTKNSDYYRTLRTPGTHHSVGGDVDMYLHEHNLRLGADFTLVALEPMEVL